MQQHPSFLCTSNTTVISYKSTTTSLKINMMKYIYYSKYYCLWSRCLMSILSMKSSAVSQRQKLYSKRSNIDPIWEHDMHVYNYKFANGRKFKWQWWCVMTELKERRWICKWRWNQTWPSFYVSVFFCL